MNIEEIDKLYEQADKARKEWKRLELMLNYADDDMLESIILKIKGYKSEYTALARRISREVFDGKQIIESIRRVNKNV